MLVVCTPTKNRRWSWEFSKACMDAQTVRPHAWIVVDNSTLPQHDWSPSASHTLVEYHTVTESKSIGWLRNHCMQLALAMGAEMIIFWDDDDYYPPERIETGIEALRMNPTVDIAASSHMYVLLTKENALMEVGPFGPNHGTAATYTIRRRYAETHSFPDSSRGEELLFTNHWTEPMVQLPAEKTIVVMGHSRNTVNKSVIHETPQVFKARMINEVNGKMMFRSRWPVLWGLFRSTFVDGEYAKLRESIPKELTPTAGYPSPHTVGTAVSDAHRV